jgi:hypothetical protein
VTGAYRRNWEDRNIRLWSRIKIFKVWRYRATILLDSGCQTKRVSRVYREQEFDNLRYFRRQYKEMLNLWNGKPTHWKKKLFSNLTFWFSTAQLAELLLGHFKPSYGSSEMQPLGHRIHRNCKSLFIIAPIISPSISLGNMKCGDLKKQKCWVSLKFTSFRSSDHFLALLTYHGSVF